MESNHGNTSSKKFSPLVFRYFLLLFLVSFLLLGHLFWPLFSILIFSFLLSGLFQPVFKFLHVRMKFSQQFSSLVTCFFIVIVVFVPLMLFVAALSKEVLRGVGLLQHFDVVLGSDSVRAIKPSPLPILDLMERFHVLPGETVIIGDSNYDVEAGKAAGIQTIAVTYGFRSRDVLKDADFLIDRFDDLLNTLRQINKA